LKKKGLKFKDWPLLNKPREKMLRYGEKKLSVVELLAVLIGVGTRDLNVLDCAGGVLTSCGGVKGLRKMKLSSLLKTKGLSLAKAARLKAALELGKRLSQEDTPAQKIISSASDLVDFYLAETRNLKQSTFYLVLLDGRNKIIFEEEIFRGTLTGSQVHPREIFGRATEERAAAVVVLHNHPSGNSRPTGSDLKTAKRLKRAGEILGILLFDYIVLGKDSHFSLRGKGII